MLGHPKGPHAFLFTFSKARSRFDATRASLHEKSIRAIREPLDVAGGCVCRPFASGVHSAARLCNVFRRVSESVIGQDNVAYAKLGDELYDHVADVRGHQS